MPETNFDSVRVGSLATAGPYEASEVYAGASSHQTIAADLELTAGAGTSTNGTSAFLAALMGNLLGATLTKTKNYLAGMLGALSVTGTKATELQAGGVVGIIMDGVTEADGAVVAVIDGSDPSAVTRANAAFAARMNNNDAGSGVDYGLDLYDAGRSAGLFTGGGLPLAVAKAEIRMSSQVCFLTGDGAPVNGTTGDNFAGKGSVYSDYTNGVLYINEGAITNPTWVKVGLQS